MTARDIAPLLTLPEELLDNIVTLLTDLSKDGRGYQGLSSLAQQNKTLYRICMPHIDTPAIENFVQGINLKDALEQSTFFRRKLRTLALTSPDYNYDLVGRNENPLKRTSRLFPSLRRIEVRFSGDDETLSTQSARSYEGKDCAIWDGLEHAQVITNLGISLSQPHHTFRVSRSDNTSRTLTISGQKWPITSTVSYRSASKRFIPRLVTRSVIDIHHVIDLTHRDRATIPIAGFECQTGPFQALLPGPIRSTRPSDYLELGYEGDVSFAGSALGLSPVTTYRASIKGATDREFQVIQRLVRMTEDSDVSLMPKNGQVYGKVLLDRYEGESYSAAGTDQEREETDIENELLAETEEMED
jgi:hypothetical protein